MATRAQGIRGCGASERRSDGGCGRVGVSWAQRIAAESDLDAEVVQGVLIRAAALAVAEGVAMGAPLAARMIGLPDDEPVASVEGAVALAAGSVVEAQAALLRELAWRAGEARFDHEVRVLVERELTGLGVPRRERAHAADLLFRVAALASGESRAAALERVLSEVDPVVQMPIREMIRETGWGSLERWLDEVTFWWVA